MIANTQIQFQVSSTSKLTRDTFVPAKHWAFGLTV